MTTVRYGTEIPYGATPGGSTPYGSTEQRDTIIHLSANPGLHASNIMIDFSGGDAPINIRVHYTNDTECFFPAVEPSEEISIHGEREIEWVEFESLLATRSFFLNGLAMKLVTNS